MKVLVTGATGLLGSYLIRELLVNHEVHGFRRKESSNRLVQDIEGKVTWHEGEITDYQSLQDATVGIDAVWHVAGLVSFKNRDQEKLLTVNTEGTANLVNVMLENGPKKLVFISSVAALGKDPDTQLIDEEYKWVTSELNTPYAISKHLAELEVWRGAQEGLEVLVFNPSVLLARHKDDRSSTMVYDYVFKGISYFPQGSINYIDIRDAAEIMVKIAEVGTWNNRFIINKESLPYKKFFEEIAKVTGKKAPHKPLTKGLLAAALFFSRITNFFGTFPVSLNKQSALLSQMNFTFDNRKSGRVLPYEYTPLAETLKWAFDNKD
ncbi:NAD-dependent epimerase/dehydratase family protein [Pleomorphovibrio marinus]|uniref:NAD-dependent epimerase/dehydratase family protein n=1 Tax=Pleomorphovibrio marinus TaxID=2164132 RepID=UPI000E0B7897|nr:NAD-dependent epimerase/dehydratase family protein [Pleomorphovibrio marinus]